MHTSCMFSFDYKRIHRQASNQHTSFSSPYAAVLESPDQQHLIKVLQTITPSCHQTAQHILPAVPTSYSWLLYPVVLQPRVVTLNKDSLLWQISAFIFCIYIYDIKCLIFSALLGQNSEREDLSIYLSYLSINISFFRV